MMERPRSPKRHDGDDKGTQELAISSTNVTSSCNGTTTKASSTPGRLDEIIPNFLFLSGLEESKSLSLLRGAGITHILTVGKSMPATYTSEFSYQLIDSLEDVENALIIKHFDECFSFIELARKSEQGRLLVHCEGGVSRSATVCAAYLMKTEHLSPSEAVELLQMRRSVVSPNAGFRRQLQLFASCGCTVDPDAVARFAEADCQAVKPLSRSRVTFSRLPDMFEAPSKNYSYEVETSCKADNFVSAVLEETIGKKKKKEVVMSHYLSTDDGRLTDNHRELQGDMPVKASFTPTGVLLGCGVTDGERFSSGGDFIDSISELKLLNPLDVGMPVKSSSFRSLRKSNTIPSLDTSQNISSRLFDLSKHNTVFAMPTQGPGMSETTARVVPARPAAEAGAGTARTQLSDGTSVSGGPSVKSPSSARLIPTSTSSFIQKNLDDGCTSPVPVSATSSLNDGRTDTLVSKQHAVDDTVTGARESSWQSNVRRLRTNSTEVPTTLAVCVDALGSMHSNSSSNNNSTLSHGREEDSSASKVLSPKPNTPPNKLSSESGGNDAGNDNTVAGHDNIRKGNSTASKTSSSEQGTEKATLVVGKVLLGYTMTPADECVVTQWLANEPEALTGGGAFKGLRQALRMMRRASNKPDNCDETSSSVQGLQHSLQHVSHILEQFTGFPLHSSKFMRMLQSEQGLDSILSNMENEFKTALSDMRACKSPDRKLLFLQQQQQRDSSELVDGEQKSSPTHSPDSSPTLSLRNVIGAQGNACSESIADANTSEATAAENETENSSVAVVSGTDSDNSNNSTMNVTTVPVATKTSTNQNNTSSANINQACGNPWLDVKHRRGRSATIDLLMLLSKLGLRREQMVSDHFYHSLSQFLEGGKKEIVALEKLDQSSAIELLGYLESFPDAMKQDPRVSRLGLICKARLVLMVAIDSVDEICDELLAQRSVTGHVRDVTTYCLNFSGALIGTQINILRKAARERLAKEKAAARIQAWRRNMCESSSDKERLGNQVAQMWPQVDRRQNTLRSWHTSELDGGLPDPTTAGARADEPVSPHMSGYNSSELALGAGDGLSDRRRVHVHHVHENRHYRSHQRRWLAMLTAGVQDRGSRHEVQSNSVVSSINLVLSNRHVHHDRPISAQKLFNYDGGSSPSAEQLGNGMSGSGSGSSGGGVLTSRSRKHRTSLTTRPRQPAPQNETFTCTYPFKPGAEGANNSGGRPVSHQYRTMPASDVCTDAGGSSINLVSASSSVNSNNSTGHNNGGGGGGGGRASLRLIYASSNTNGSGSTARAALTSGNPNAPSQLLISDLGSATSSNSITNSAFYLASELSPKHNLKINPIHALQGILRHLSRVVVSEARQNMATANPMSQKLKTLQGYAKKLRHVHPRVCVADNESRPGLCRLPRASEELQKYVRNNKFGVNQTPYCFDFRLRVMAFFPPCSVDTALQPPNDTSAEYRSILSTVFDLMPVETEALHDLTETAVFSQHASAGYALTTTLHYVDKLSQTSYLANHHLGDETCKVGGSVAGGYLHFEPDSARYIFTEESGHYGLRWTHPGTRQSLDTFIQECNNDIVSNYVLKPFHRTNRSKKQSVVTLFSQKEFPELPNADDGTVITSITAATTPQVTTSVGTGILEEESSGTTATQPPTAPGIPVEEVGAPAWDFD